MLQNLPQRIGEMLNIAIQFDPVDRIFTPDNKLMKVLSENPAAKLVFEKNNTFKAKGDYPLYFFFEIRRKH